MTSQSLYRKWRSQTFDDLVGQEPIVDTLKNELKSGKLCHAYLFTGPRGTGKTSTARLLAKTVNCEHPCDGEPCNECAQCREITAGNSFNVIEIDAASNRGIDNIRELRERVMVPPTSGKYKVYVLDEAHMLTTEAFNALLKTLEEPPDYAIFVLATTEVHKMLPTVISRCQQFNFKRITTRLIVEHLNYVAQQEGITLERSAVELIARAAAGGMRDALSLLDQAIAYAGNEIELSQVQAMLGVADPRAIAKFITHIADLDGSAVLHLINDLSEAGAELRQVNAQVMEYFRALLLTRAGANAAEILDLTQDEMQEITQLAGRFALEELTECARIFAQNELTQKNQGTPQLGLELAALDCLEVHRRVQSGQPVHVVPAAIAQVRPQDNRVAQGRDGAARGQGQPVQYTSVAQDGRQQTPVQWGDQPAPEAGKLDEQEQPAKKALAGSGEDGDGGRSALTVLQVARAWENVKKRAKQKSALLAANLAHFDVVGVQGSSEQPIVVVQAKRMTHFKFVKEENRYKILEWALQVEFNLPSCQVRLLTPDESPKIAEQPQTYSTDILQAATQDSAFHEPNAIHDSSEPFMSATSPLPDSRGEQQNDEPSALFLYNGDTPLNTPDLAKKSLIRENRQGASHESQETLEQKARRDPVVQEVIRTFKANIVDIHSK